jgi:5-methyltetrahydrofolate--homocysteine methyltransferase
MTVGLEQIIDTIQEGKTRLIEDSVRKALDAGFDPNDILNKGMIPAIIKVGQRFEDGEFFLPEMLVSARTMQAGLNILKPYLQDTGYKSSGKILIGTVQGDLHEIGKNLVGMMLEGSGFEVIDLGADVSPEKFVEAVILENPDIIALSALLTTTMPKMDETIKALQSSGLREKAKVIIGGAPVTEYYAHQIDADGYSPDASKAVWLVKALLKK